MRILGDDLWLNSNTTYYCVLLHSSLHSFIHLFTSPLYLLSLQESLKLTSFFNLHSNLSDFQMEFSAQRSIHGHSSDQGKGKMKRAGKMKRKPSQSLECEDEHQPLDICKPYMLFIMAEYHVGSPYQLVLPVKIHRLLPKATVPVVLICRNKTWMTSYLGDGNKRFDVSGWRIFATENMLKEGDGCVFELMEWSNKIIKFKVQILNGDVPPELFLNCDGNTSNAPIAIE